PPAPLGPCSIPSRPSSLKEIKKRPLLVEGPAAGRPHPVFIPASGAFSTGSERRGDHSGLSFVRNSRFFWIVTRTSCAERSGARPAAGRRPFHHAAPGI